MIYRVILNDRAEGQLEAAYLWWLEHRSPKQATRWYNEFLEALHGLRENPGRFGVAHEDPKFPYSVRELRFGMGSRVTHRALFTIRDDIVYVFSIRHVAQKDVSPDEL
jgi:plasmid stabilization system protein ParE